jgi:hypothetical protein
LDKGQWEVDQLQKELSVLRQETALQMERDQRTSAELSGLTKEVAGLKQAKEDLAAEKEAAAR